MNWNTKDRNTLIHIKNYCLEITETINYFGDSFKEYQTNKIYRNATVMCVLQIGELVNHLSDEFKESNTEIPWKDFKVLRNIAAHNYGSFSAKRTWVIAKEEIPKLYEFCQNFF